MTRSDVLRVIAREEVFVDLATEDLASGRARLFPDESSALAMPAPSTPFETMLVRPPAPVEFSVGRKLAWAGATWVLEVLSTSALWLRNLASPEADLVQLHPSQAEKLARQGEICGVEGDLAADISGKALVAWNAATPDGRRVAQERYRAIAVVLAGGPLPEVGKRRIQRWRDAYRSAEKTRGNGLLGLLPNWARHGRQLKPAIAKEIDTVLVEHEFTPTGKSLKAIYGEVIKRVQDLFPDDVPQRKTVARRIARLDANSVIRARQGDAVAYQSEPFVFYLDYDSPVHGSWPWHIAHLDHTELDIVLISSATGEVLGKPWLTLLQDAYSRRVLSMWLTFDPPSYRSGLMALRICVARHGRLPQTIVVDNGSDFKSTHFEQALAWHKVSKRERPARKPRYGATLERLLGVATQQLIHNLPGNTKVTKNVRQMTKEVNPDNNASLDLLSLYELLSRYFAESHETQVHRSLRSTPAKVYERGMALRADRPTTHIAYTVDFVASLLPTTDTGSAKVDPNQGVTINYIPYWTDAFRRPGVSGSQVAVRFDPFDLRYVLAHVEGEWHRCVPFSLPGGWPRSERELMVVTSEIKAEYKLLDKRYRASALSLANDLDRAKVAAKALAQRLRDREAAGLIKALDLDVLAADDDDDFLSEPRPIDPLPVDELPGSTVAANRPTTQTVEPLDWHSVGLSDTWSPYE